MNSKNTNKKWETSSKIKDIFVFNGKETVNKGWGYSKEVYQKQFLTFDSETTQIDRYTIDKKGNKEINSESTPILFQLATSHKKVYIGRTIEDIKDAFTYISDECGKHDQKIICYVHNLTYDIYFLLNEFLEGEIEEDIFIIKNKIARFTWGNIEFRDSLMLFRAGLKKVLEDYAPDWLDKTDGWDYNVIRSPKSELTEDELKYAIIDVIGLVYALERLCELNHTPLISLPITSTGFTRRRLAESIKKLKPSERTKFRKKINSLTLTVEQYTLAKRAYFGGVADTNPSVKDLLIKDAHDKDIASEYPHQMVTNRYPMSAPIWTEITHIDELDELIKRKYGFIGRFVFTNLKVKKQYPIPSVINYTSNRGDSGVVKSGSRLYSAEKITLYQNDIDFNLLRDIYTFEDVKVEMCMCFKMDYLPKPIVMFILDGYRKKTAFKGLPDKEDEYLHAKVDVNTGYGMTAEDPVHTEYYLDYGEFKRSEKTDEYIKSKIDEYNESDKRNVYYLWGQYTASYGHRALFDGMKIVKENIICCDTDSVKFTGNFEKQFNILNDIIKEKNKMCAKIFNIPEDLYYPKTKAGVEKHIGVWENDDISDYGKLIGIISKRPKCYIKQYENGYKYTIAGISAKKFSKFAESESKKHNITIPDIFASNPTIPAEQTGKLTHKYNNVQEGWIYTDYQGHTHQIPNQYGVTLTPAPFSLNERDEDDGVRKLINFIDGYSIYA